jgi:hypothetical protein
MSKQLTKEQALAFEEWKHWTPIQIALFQINQKLLCMPFDVFHKAVEDALGRPVWTHEFGLNHDGLREELMGLRDAPTFEGICNLIPPEKLIVAYSGGDAP